MSNQNIEYVDGMKICHGYNRLTGDALGSPMVAGSVSAVPQAGGQQVSLDCVTITDTEVLHRAVGISVEAGGSYMGVSASAKVDYVHTCDFSSYSTYVMVRVSVRDAFESIDAPAFVQEAVDLLTANNTDRFRARCGDSYIAGILKGGEYFAIYQLTGTNDSEKESLGLSVHAAFNGLLASADLNVAINNATSSSKSHLEVQVHVFRQGEIGTADFKVDDIMATARQFPVAVSGDKAFPYAVQLQDYAGLKSPNDKFSYYDIKQQQDVLEDLAKKRFAFLTLRDDLAYVLKHSEDFVNADGSAVDHAAISATYDEVVNEINTMQVGAKACSVDPDQCKFTTFDVSKFTVPQVKKGATGPVDAKAVKGQAIANADALVAAIRGAQPDGPQRLGFDIGMGEWAGQTSPGPGKTNFRDGLPADQQIGFDVAAALSLSWNNNVDFAAKGATVVKADAAVAAARAKGPLGPYWLGFNIGTGLFGDHSLGGDAHTSNGPGAEKIRLSLDREAQLGYNDAIAFNLAHRNLPPTWITPVG